MIRRKRAEKLKSSARVYGAPLALVVCADHADSWKRSFDGKDAADIDATIVTTHMMLAAADLGLDSIWVCHFDPDGVRSDFGLPGRRTDQHPRHRVPRRPGQIARPACGRPQTAP